ncbi:sensitivity to red light reduced protein [Perilla frutescens var. hirtella]|uniref:Sensitivity to red light reduced protein n=1 Tax=Perilla frutescens var. hirtella TaxID=608512 RepID=A0AAD4IYW6_PERFH|nr:sensitivity to red light reduced protein [Perilla frutescens var. frutescens]KAH6823686.1 sensitivity to red light reduced protein [Perilla frutescens var. hirtella]
MAASPKTISLEKSDLSEDWTVVLPRRGKKNRVVNKFVIPKRDKEVQLWAPIDLETDPERESKLMQKMQICIQKFENSEFHGNLLNQIKNPDMLDKFLRVLGSEKKMQMVIYGIGSIESYESPRLQLSLAILLKRSFDWIGEIELFDPIISLTESKVLTSLGCSVLSINEQCRRQAVKPTMFFMPHCEVELYNNLLEANWEVDQLNRLIIFGNSFGEYEHHASLFKSSAVAKSRKHVLGIRSFTEELRVNTSSNDFRAFNCTSWHFFSPCTEADLQMMDFDKF